MDPTKSKYPNSDGRPSSEPQFDRVITIEMLEHMKNYHVLFKKVASWLKPGGKMFGAPALHFDVQTRVLV
eukprot:SAG11_NODE_1574_length_4659_cov_4.583333_5_plen_70_part_00